ncbi:MAG: hypothetical protein SGBAC_009092 [Bacillariaceae sp.]
MPHRFGSQVCFQFIVSCNLYFFFIGGNLIQKLLLARPYHIGYKTQYLSLEKFLSEQSFAKEIEVFPLKDAGFTGNFEVRIGSDKQLIHSKRTAGQGRAESAQERAMIVEFIKEYLDAN